MAREHIAQRLRGGQRARRIALQSMGIGGFYLIVLVFFSVRSNSFLSGSNAQTILDDAAMLGIVAVGQSFAIISGGFDLSVGGLVPLGAVIYGELLPDMPPLPALLLVVAVGVVFGVVVGWIIIRLGMNPLIATLAFLSVSGGIAYVVSGGQTFALNTPGAGYWGEDSLLGINNAAWAFIVIAVLAGLILKYSVYGRSLFVVGGNREAAELAGLNVTVVSISAYVVSAACATLAGAISASQLLAAAPDIGTTTSLDSVAAVVLGGAALTGGVGSIIGTVLGVLLLGTISDGLALLQVQTYYQTVATGVILLLAVGLARLRDQLSITAFLMRRHPTESEYQALVADTGEKDESAQSASSSRTAN